MRIADQQAIRGRTAMLVTDWADSRHPPVTGETAEGLVEAIAVANVVADEARLNLHRWIDAARRVGLSWTEIGDALGISKQAAQQRFRPVGGDNDLPDDDGTRVVRLGANAFNEMTILREEGLNGHELMATGAFKLMFRPTRQRWDYARRIGGAAMIANMTDAGWTYVSSWLPFHYFKRLLPSD